jgi:hypothetical protein
MEWLQRKRHELQAQLCGDVLETIVKGKGFDTLADAAVIADALAATLGKPSASIVAVILMRRGLTSLCRDGAS